MPIVRNTEYAELLAAPQNSGFNFGSNNPVKASETERPEIPGPEVYTNIPLPELRKFFT